MGVGRPMGALSVHVQKPYKGISVLVLAAVVLSRIVFFSTRLLHACVRCVYNVSAKYQMVPLEAVVGVGWPVGAPSVHVRRPY